MIEMTPVESSNIAAIGYLPDVCLLRVKFRDGAQYDWLNVSPEAHAALMAAPSKGKHLREHFPAGVRCLADGGEVPHIAPHIVGEQPGVTITPDDVLVLEDLDPCCKRHLTSIDRSKIEMTECPKCGQEFRMRMIAGVRTWLPHCAVQVWKR